MTSQGSPEDPSVQAAARAPGRRQRLLPWTDYLPPFISGATGRLVGLSTVDFAN